MTTINGRRIKLLKEDGQPTGTARSWKPESDWMKVVTDDGVTYMVHCSDPIEILRENASPISSAHHSPAANKGD